MDYPFKHTILRQSLLKELNGLQFYKNYSDLAPFFSKHHNLCLQGVYEQYSLLFDTF